MKDRNTTMIPEGEERNDLEPALAEEELVDEPETWTQEINGTPTEADATDWTDQQRPVSDDPFDDDGWTDVP